MSQLQSSGPGVEDRWCPGQQPLPVSTISVPVPGVPETDQQLASGLQHAGALCHSVAGPI